MFSDFTGSFRKIVAAVAAGKAGRIDSGYRCRIVFGMEQVQYFSESEPEVQGFYPAEKFLERFEVEY
jgi:hypothetical protein